MSASKRAEFFYDDYDTDLARETAEDLQLAWLEWEDAYGDHAYAYAQTITPSEGYL